MSMLSRRFFASSGHLPGSQELPEAAFEALAGSSVHCVRAHQGTSAWRMLAQWPASASAAASRSARDLRSRCYCCSSALGTWAALHRRHGRW
eukprot:6524062-Prymnesium_polylepis.3